MSKNADAIQKALTALANELVDDEDDDDDEEGEIDDVEVSEVSKLCHHPQLLDAQSLT